MFLFLTVPWPCTVALDVMHVFAWARLAPSPTVGRGGAASKGLTIEGSQEVIPPIALRCCGAVRIPVRRVNVGPMKGPARTHGAFHGIRKPSICQVKPFEGQHTGHGSSRELRTRWASSTMHPEKVARI